MNVGANGKTLAMLTKQLSAKWDETRLSWQDVKAQEFEQHFLSELVLAVERVIPVFDQLEKLVAKVRSDCE